jgi:hypothetical protein
MRSAKVLALLAGKKASPNTSPSIIVRVCQNVERTNEQKRLRTSQPHCDLDGLSCLAHAQKVQEMNQNSN